MPDLAALVRGTTTWAVLGVVLGVGIAQAAVGEIGGVLEVVAYGLVPAVAFAVAVTGAIRRHQWVAVGGLLVAVSPAVLAGLVAGRRHAAIAIVAVLVGAGVVWWRRNDPGLVPTTVVGGSVVAASLWFVSGSRRVGPAPGTTAIAGTMGTTLRSAFGAVGDGLTLHTSVLLWVGGVGLVIGAAVVAGAPRAALVIPTAVVLYVAFAWLIEAQRGPVAPAGGAWLVAGAIAGVAASTELSRRLDRILGRALILTAAAVWVTSLVQQARVGDLPTARLLLGLVAPALVVALLWAIMSRSAPPAGVNVVGYFDRTSGLGERARTLVSVLRAAGVEVSEWPVAASVSPSRDGGPPEDPDREVFDTTIAVVTALEFPALASTHGELVGDVDRVIGYWFWELETIPASHGAALAMVDEVWTPTRFVHDAYRRVAPCPVRLVPLPIAAPATGMATGVGSSLDHGAEVEGCTFVTSFDYLSVMERKNPQGVIAAFQRAFPDGGEAVRLIVKTLNANRAPAEAARLAGLSALDRRIEIRDGHLTDAEFSDLLASADAFVSLHRSEGLGLQPAWAMWLGVPVICTAYSGVLDVIDATSALPVPYTPTEVVDGGGAYPPGAKWADPDLAVAAAAMRLIADDPERAAEFGDAGRARMQAQPSAIEAGRAVARLLAGWADHAVVDASWYGVGRTSLDSVGAMRSVSVVASGSSYAP
ncbi:MAG: glycosyltransferase family 4 protein [Ilumatobacter sp.]|nr:glycosyltransferase family 4 protein [Ilumatobacter sp.]